MMCDCGMDLLKPSGNQHDRVTCQDCGWKAAGVWAEHAGMHHWIDTQHTWMLTVFKPEEREKK